MTMPRIEPIIRAPRPFTVRERRHFAARQTKYGHRPVNDWGSGDLPAPYAEGDLLLLPEGVENDRLYGMGPGYFVVSAAFSIDEGDAWYFRVTNNDERGSDRLHVAWAARSSFEDDCNWMADFALVKTADPDGLEQREALLEAGWTWEKPPRCPTCGHVLERGQGDADGD